LSEALIDVIRAAPRLSRPDVAAQRLAELMARPDAAPLAGPMSAAPLRDLALGLADHSPYLWGLIVEDPPRFARLLAAPAERSLERIIAGINQRSDADEAELGRALRLAKRETALLVALADIGGAWGVGEVTEGLSRFGDAAVAAALRFLLRANAAAGRLTIDPDERAPEVDCGLVVLALGKHGAQELNYSSDVDLIVLFDPQASTLPADAVPGPLFVRITKALARLLQERTSEGYVLRVDLRLRPDPGATPIALAIPSAYAYYETVGQNWERAAMIKARPVAGDLAIGARFLETLGPFIWRKYFDYASIADIHAMKRQIHAVRGHEHVAVPGHDIKLGRGGIREIEFFVQTQQLIFGGRRPRMRGARTLDMLAELRADGWVSETAAAELTEAYLFLRRVEHRLQMVADEQTQRLPFDAEELTRFAAFCGYDSLDAFAADLVMRLHNVERHYARLFEHAEGLDASAGSLVFTGVVDDPDTLETLRRLGFRQPEQAAETIRGWHFGRRAAVRGPRAREALTEVTPVLLAAFSGSGDPDAALAALDAALGRMPAVVELFSILRSNSEVRELFADVLGSAPRLANVVAMRPHVLDGAIDPGRARLVADGLDAVALARRVAAYVAHAPTFESVLDRVRDFAAEEMFLIGVRLLSGVLDPDHAGRAYSALAEGVTSVLLDQVKAAFALEHGVLAGGRVAVVALGKFGSREMTAASDLDLMLIYDFVEESGESDGPRPLGATQYYTRLTQRLLAALTAPTKAGRLYEVDLRLRPSGRKGPVATKLASFIPYQRDEAETWEHMALTRARVVAGDAALARAIEAAIAGTLEQKVDRARLANDVRDMRALIAREKGEADPWDLKLVAGGLLDIEFLAQFLTLAWAHERPAIRDVSTRAVIANAAAETLLATEQAEILVAAHRLFTDATQLMRLSIDGPFDPAQATGGVKRRIAAAAGQPDFEALADALVEARGKVRAIFRAVVG
jgi:glutamate-ammonia-ligase adenylyltransferase